MKVINLDHFAKGVLVLSLAAFVSGCGNKAEEAAKQKQPGAAAEVIQGEEVITESVPDESGDIAEESLESILAKADEIIQRTSAANSNAKPDPKKNAENAAEGTGAIVATTPKKGTETADDGKETVKATPDIIRKIQQALTDAGLNPGTADGKMGPRSKNALIDFQKKHGLTEGKITRETLRELGITF